MTKASIAVVIAVGISGAVIALGDAPFFMGLGDLPGGTSDSYAYGISDDGTTIVGVASSSTALAEAFRWTTEAGMVGLGVLPDSLGDEALGVSPEANVIAGQWYPRTPAVTFAPLRWTADEGLAGLAPLDPNQPRGRAYGATDAAVTVGYTGEYRPVKWGLDAQPIALELPPYYEQGFARAITPDGSLIVGATGRPGVWYATVWSDQHDVRAICAGVARDVTPDGSVIVGSYEHAWRWTEEDGRVYLGWLLDPSETNTARAVSADGSVAVGWARDGSAEAAFIWESLGSMRSLPEVLENDYGLDLTGWELLRAYDISADGRTIVGVGIHDGHHEAWSAHIPEPSCVWLMAIAAASQLRRRQHVVSSGRIRL